jgi:hypothetical protein
MNCTCTHVRGDLPQALRNKYDNFTPPHFKWLSYSLVYNLCYWHVNVITLLRFQVLTAASMKIRAFWDAAPCNLVGADRRFKGAYCLHHQGDRWALLKCQYNPTRLHGATSQKAVIFLLNFYSDCDKEFSLLATRWIVLSHQIYVQGPAQTFIIIVSPQTIYWEWWKLLQFLFVRYPPFSTLSLIFFLLL